VAPPIVIYSVPKLYYKPYYSVYIQQLPILSIRLSILLIIGAQGRAIPTSK